jgi:hypothetical protein
LRVARLPVVRCERQRPFARRTRSCLGSGSSVESVYRAGMSAVRILSGALRKTSLGALTTPTSGKIRAVPWPRVAGAGAARPARKPCPVTGPCARRRFSPRSADRCRTLHRPGEPLLDDVISFTVYGNARRGGERERGELLDFLIVHREHGPIGVTGLSELARRDRRPTVGSWFGHVYWGAGRTSSGRRRSRRSASGRSGWMADRMDEHAQRPLAGRARARRLPARGRPALVAAVSVALSWPRLRSIWTPDRTPRRPASGLFITRL